MPINLTPIIEANQSELDRAEFQLLGQIEKLKEDLIKVRAKKEHNAALLRIIQDAENTDTAKPDSDLP